MKNTNNGTGGGLLVRNTNNGTGGGLLVKNTNNGTGGGLLVRNTNNGTTPKDAGLLREAQWLLSISSGGAGASSI